MQILSDKGYQSRIYTLLQLSNIKDNLYEKQEKDLNRHFFKEDKWPMSTEKMRDIISCEGNAKNKKNKKTLKIPTVRYYTPIRMAIIKNSDNNCWLRCRETGTITHGWWEYKMEQILWKTAWQFLRHLNIELS